jgi:hypothetical protein
VYGAWGLPIPRKVPITVVVGHPIQVPKAARDDKQFEAYVDDAHERYTAAIQQLYEDFREEYNDGCQSWRDRPLQVV